MIDLYSRPRRKPDIISQQASNTQLLLHLDSGRYYALNAVGTRVWQLCDGVHSVEEMVTTITAEYDAPRETIEADVLELLRDLAAAQLVDASA